MRPQQCVVINVVCVCGLPADMVLRYAQNVEAVVSFDDRIQICE